MKTKYIFVSLLAFCTLFIFDTLGQNLTVNFKDANTSQLEGTLPEGSTDDGVDYAENYSKVVVSGGSITSPVTVYILVEPGGDNPVEASIPNGSDMVTSTILTLEIPVGNYTIEREFSVNPITNTDKPQEFSFEVKKDKIPEKDETIKLTILDPSKHVFFSIGESVLAETAQNISTSLNDFTFISFAVKDNLQGLIADELRRRKRRLTFTREDFLGGNSISGIEFLTEHPNGGYGYVLTRNFNTPVAFTLRVAHHSRGGYCDVVIGTENSGQATYKSTQPVSIHTLINDDIATNTLEVRVVSIANSVLENASLGARYRATLYKTDGTFATTNDLPTPSASFSVYYTLSGTATPAIDYSHGYNTFNARSFTFPANALETTLIVGIVNDSIVEPPETIILHAYATNSDAIFVDVDNDMATVTIISEDASGGYTVGLVRKSGITINETENAVYKAVLYSGSLLVKPTDEGLSTTDTTITFNITGTAVGVKYTGNANRTVVLPASQVEVDLELQITNNSLIEDPVELSVELESVAPNYTLNSDVTKLNRTIRVESEDMIELSIKNQDFNEGDVGTTTTPILTVKGADITGRSEDFSVTIAVSQTGSASIPEDFNVTGGTTVGTTRTITFSIPKSDYTVVSNQDVPINLITISGDTKSENDESFVLTLTATAPGDVYSKISSSNVGLMNIIDDDKITIKLERVGADNIDESAVGASVQFKAVLYKGNVLATTVTSGLPTAPITVEYQLLGTATEGSDYADKVTQQVSIPVGSVEGAFSFMIENDGLIEGDETLMVRLTRPTVGSAIISAIPSDVEQTVTIKSEDKLTITVEDADIEEGNADNDVSLQISVSGANLPSAYVTSNPVTVDITITDGADVTTGAMSTGVDLDYSINDGRVSGTAFSVSIPAGDYTATTPLNVATVNIKGDVVYKGDKTFALALSSPVPTASVELGTSTIATFTIKENELVTASLNIDFTNANTSQQEGNTNANISGVSTLTVGGGVLATDETVYIYVGSGNNKSVLFDITGGAFQATPALNYKDVLAETIIPVVIPANDYSTSQTIPLPTTLIQVVGDSRIEDNEELQLFLLKPSENFFYKMGEITTATTAHVINTPLTDFTVMTFDIHGLGQKRTWAVVKQQFTGGVYERSPLMTTNPTSGYLRLNMTARLVDGVYQFTIQFDPGINVGSFSNLVIRGMTATAGFSTPTRETSTHTILNDDKLTLSVVNADIAEGDADNDVPLQLMVSGGTYVTQSSANPMSVQVTITDGTGVTGAKSTGAEIDYSINDGRVSGAAFSFTIPTGDYRTATSINLATVNIKGDTEYKGDKTFDLALSSPVPTASVELGTSSSATFTIKENEPAPTYTIKLEVVNTTVDESAAGATAEYRVALYNGNTKATTSFLTTAVTVNYEIVATSTATSPEDYDTPATTSVTLVAGSVDQVINIPIKNDANVEVDESLIVRLTGPTTGTPVISTTATDIEKTVTITSEDFIPDLTSFTIADPVASLALGTDFDLSTLVITPTPTNAVTGTLTWTIPTATAGYSIVGTMLRSDENTVTGLSVTVQASSGTGASVITATKEINFETPTLTGIAVARADAVTDNVMVFVGETLNLATTFTVAPVPPRANLDTTALTWSAAPAMGSTATTTIAGTTLTAGATTGDVTLTVTSGGASIQSATIDITITAPPLVSFTIGNPVGAITLGTNFDLNTLPITPTPTNAVTGTLTWSIPTATTGYSIVGTMLRSDENTATGLSVTVQASSGTGGSVITATKEIIFPVPTLTGITVARADAVTDNVTVVAGGTLNLATTYTVRPLPSLADLDTTTLTWSATSTAATATIVGTTLTAGPTAGDVTLTVTSGGASIQSATIDITLTAPPLVSFTIGDPIGAIALSTDFDLSTLTITPTPTNAVTGNLTWTIPTATAGYSIVGTMLRSDENVVTGLSVTVQASSGTGASVITATKEITFPVPTLTGMTVVRTDAVTDNVAVVAGRTLDLAATYMVSAVPSLAVLGAYTWSVASKGTSPATGTIVDTTLTTGGTEGDLTLTVTSGIASVQTAMIDVTVIAPSVLVSFTIGDPLGHTLGTDFDLSTLTITTIATDADTGVLTWTIPTATTGYSIVGTTLRSDENTATGLSVTVQASSGAGVSAITATKEITFPTPTLTAISLTRKAGTGNVTVQAGETLDLEAIYMVSAVPSLAVLGAYTWSVAPKGGSTATATVAGTTLTAGATAGEVTLTATTTGASVLNDTIDITISTTAPPTLTGVTIGDPTGPLALGTAVNMGPLLTPIPPTASLGAVTWSLPNAVEGYSIDTTTGVLTSDATATTQLTVQVVATSGTVTSQPKTITFPTPAINAISVTRKAGTGNVMLQAGEALDLEAIYTVSAIPRLAVLGAYAWSVAPKGSATASGTIVGTTLTAGATAGDLILTATTTGAPLLSDTIDITISTTAPTALIGITIGDPVGPLVLGTVVNMGPLLTPFPSVASLGVVTWSIPNPVPAGYSIDATTGVLTSDATATTQLTVQVVATSGTVTSQPKTITFPTPTLASISLTRRAGIGNVTLQAGETLDLEAIYMVSAVPRLAVLGAYTWSVAPKGSSTATGTIAGTTLTAGATAGDLILTATTTGVPVINDTIDVTILTTAPPTLTGITVGDPVGPLALGTDVNMGSLLTPVPPTASLGAVTWSLPNAVEGYSIDTTTGVLTSDATATTLLTVQVVATSGTVSSQPKTITFPTPTLTAISLTRKAGTGNVTLQAGETLDLETIYMVSAIPKLAVLGAYIWSVVPKGSSTATGTIAGTTLTVGATAGDLTLTATTTGATILSDTIDITILTTARPTLIGITIGGPVRPLVLGTVVNMGSLLTPVPSTASLGVVTWSIPTPVPVGYSIDATTGVLTSDATATTQLTVQVVATSGTVTSQPKTITFPTPTLTSISLTRRAGTGNVTVQAGETLDLEAIYKVSAVPRLAVLGAYTWSVAPKGSSTATGTIAGTTLTAGASAGDLILTATTTGMPVLNDTIDITISTTATPTLTGITIGDPVGPLALGTDVNMGSLLTPVPPTASLGVVTWSLPSPVVGYSIDATTGVLTSDATATTQLNVQVVATSGTVTSQPKTITFPTPTLTAMSVTRKAGTGNVTLQAGETLDLEAIYMVSTVPSLAVLGAYTWSVAPKGSSTATGTIAGTMLTAGATAGDLTLTATTTGVPTLSDTIDITISTTAPPTLTGITIDDPQGLLVLGTDVNMGPLLTPVPPTASLGAVTWSIPSPVPVGYSIDTTTGVLTSDANVVIQLTVQAVATSGTVTSQPKTVAFPTPTLTAISVTRKAGTGKVTLQAGESLDLEAIYMVSAVPRLAVLGAYTWSVAPKGSSTATGTIAGTTLTAGATAGDMILTATTTGVSVLSDTIDITISTTATPTLTGITIGDPVGPLALGTDVNMGSLLTPVPPTAPLGVVTWSLPNAVAGYSIDTTTGVLTSDVTATSQLIVQVVATSGTVSSQPKTITFPTPTLTAISVTRKAGTGNVILQAGESLDLETIYTVFAVPRLAVLGVYTWSVAPKGGSTATGTIAGATLTAGATAGDLTLTATTTGASALSDAIDITISATTPPALTGITIEDPVSPLVLGTSVNMGPLLTPVPPTASLGAVTWSIPSPVPVGYSIDTTTGVLTSDANVVTQLTVQAVATSGTVTSQPKTVAFPTPTLTAISVTRKAGTGNVTLQAGESLDLEAIYMVSAVPRLAVLGAYTWSVIPKGSSTATGTIAGTTLTAGATAGDMILTATTTGASVLNDTIDITISSTATPTLTGITIGDPVGPLALGTDVNMGSLLTPVPPTAPLGAVTWSLPNAVAGYSIGTTTGVLSSDVNAVTQLTVQVVATSDTVTSQPKTITFLAPTLTAISVSRKAGTGNVTLQAGEALDLEAIYMVSAVPRLAVLGAYTWSVAPKGSSTATGTIAGTTLTAGATAGDLTLTATTTGASALSDTIDITISTTAPPALTGITIGDPVSPLVIGTDVNIGPLLSPVPSTASLGVVTWSLPTPVAGYSIDTTTGVLTSDVNIVTLLTVQVVATSGTVTSQPKTITFPTPTLTAISLTRNAGTGNVTVQVGATLDLETTYTVSAVPRLAVLGAYTWSIAPKGSSTATGTIAGTTLTAGATAGDMILTATTTGVPVLSDTIGITISTSAPPALTGITIGDPVGSLVLGRVVNMGSLLTPVPPTASLGAVTWSLISSVAGYSIDATTGALTSDESVATQLTVQVVATSGTVTSQPKMITFLAPTLTAISLTRKAGTGNVTLQAGETLDLEAIYMVSAVPRLAVLGAYTWSIAPKGSSTATGTIAGTTLTAGATAGDLTLTATTTGASALSDAIDITISTTAPPALTGITIGDPVGPLVIGADVNMGPLLTPVPSTASLGVVTWSLPTPVAGYSIDGTTGVLTSDANAVTQLTVQVVATSGAVTSQPKTITFPTPTLTAISLTRKAGTGNVTVQVGATLDLEATYMVSAIPRLASLGTYSWTIAPKGSSTATATIAGTMLTAGATAGDMTLTATTTGVPVLSDTIDITLSTTAPPALTGITIGDPVGPLVLGRVVNMGSLLTPVPPTASLGAVTWSIPSAVAGYSIDTTTGALMSDVSLVTQLTVQVVATSGTVTSQPKTITFLAPTLTAISLTRKAGTGNITLQAGETLDLEAIYMVSAVPRLAVLGAYTWSIAPKGSSTATGTIAGTTLTAGATAGDLTLTVTITGASALSDTIDITISTTAPPALTGITIGDPVDPLVIGTAVNIGSLLTPVPSGASLGVVTWSLPTPVAGYSIDAATGVLTSDINAVTQLTVQVVATSGTVTSQPKTITFPTPTLTAISVTRKAGTGNVTLQAGETLDLEAIYLVSAIPRLASLGTYTWSVAPKGGSTATGTIAGTTLTAGTTAGDLTLTATTTGVPVLSDTIDLTLSTTAPPALTGITIGDPVGSLVIGRVVNLGPLLTSVPLTASLGAVTWSIPSAVVGYSIEPSTGVLTTNASVATQLSVQVVATSGTVTSQPKTITFPAPMLTSLSITRKVGMGIVMVQPRGTLDLEATYTVTAVPRLAVLGAYTWSVAPKGGSSATATIAGTTLTADNTTGIMTLTATVGTGASAISGTIDLSIETPSVYTLKLTTKDDITSVNENDTNAQARFVVAIYRGDTKLSTSPLSTFTISYEISSLSTATAPQDYSVPSSKIITFLAGVVEMPLDIDVINDNLIEDNELLTVLLNDLSTTSAMISNVPTENTQTITIVSEDILTVSIEDGINPEGNINTSQPVNINISGADMTGYTNPVSVMLTVTDNTASSSSTPADFTITGGVSGTAFLVTIPQADYTQTSNQSMPVSAIVINGDKVFEENETFSLEMTTSSDQQQKVVLGAKNSGTYTIINDDYIVKLNAITTANIQENTTGAKAQFEAVIYKSATEPAIALDIGLPKFNFTVSYEISGDVNAGEDYEDPSTKTLTFQTGTLKQIFDITILDDGLIEDIEKLTVKLSNIDRDSGDDTIAISSLVEDITKSVNIESDDQSSLIPGISEQLIIDGSIKPNVPVQIIKKGTNLKISGLSKENKIYIYNRFSELIWEQVNYPQAKELNPGATNYFTGKASSSDNFLSTGTYFILIENKLSTGIKMTSHMFEVVN